MARLIARLDIKDKQLVKGIQFEGLRKYGEAKSYAEKYFEMGFHELFMTDVMASLYGRNRLGEMIDDFSRNCRIPITAGGGINDIQSSRNVLMKGADKISINSALFKDQSLIKSLADIHGEQAIVVSIQARKKSDNSGWLVMSDAGRTHTGLDLDEWLQILKKHKFGEIIVTSIDFDGTCEGIDLDLLKTVVKNVKCPVIYSGGVSNERDIDNLFSSGADGVCIGAALHKNTLDKKILSEYSLIKKRISKYPIKSRKRNKIKCAIIDLDLGNTGSLRYFLEENECEVDLTYDHEEILNADVVWIPGVGNFGEGAERLRERNLYDPLMQRFKNGKWIVGICLGMHLLGKSSEESNKKSKGIGIFNAEVRRISKEEKSSDSLRLPHVGWNKAIFNSNQFDPDNKYYFIHSYAYLSTNKNKFSEYAISNYEGINFYSYLRIKNALGFQFHPEKSGTDGYSLLNKILNLIEDDID